ncbi:MAG: hypothetical protein ABIN67_11590 [Ferruginibacter sp.]
MSKHQLIAAFLLLGTVTIFSCQKEHDADNPNCANNTGWLKNGHKPVFVITSIYIAADTLYTSFEEVSPGVFKSTSTFDNGTFYPTQTVYMQACGNIVYQSQSLDFANKQEAYRLNGNIGDTWTTSVISTGGNTVTTVTTITEKNVSKTVPAGTFICIKLHQVSTSSAGGSVTSDTYLNNDAGPVLLDGTTAHYELARKNY